MIDVLVERTDQKLYESSFSHPLFTAQLLPLPMSLLAQNLAITMVTENRWCLSVSTQQVEETKVEVSFHDSTRLVPLTLKCISPELKLSLLDWLKMQPLSLFNTNRAVRVFCMLKETSLEFDLALVENSPNAEEQVKINTMLNCLVAKSAEKDLAFALSIFWDLQLCDKSGFAPDAVSYNAMIFSQARAQELDAALDMFEEIIRLKFMPSVRACNAILFECARRGRLLKAVQVNCWLHRPLFLCALLLSLSSLHKSPQCLTIVWLQMHP